jgi:hypothetical protein
LKRNKLAPNNFRKKSERIENIKRSETTRSVKQLERSLTRRLLN